MDELLKSLLGVFSLWLIYNAIALLFAIPEITLPFTNEELLSEYRQRVLVPTLFLTVLYFVYRYFRGKNPTSPLWPVYVTLCSWLACNLIALSWISSVRGLIIGLGINITMLVIVRSAHNKRKNEIF